VAGGFLNDGPGVFQRVSPEELPLRGAEPEDGSPVLIYLWFSLTLTGKAVGSADAMDPAADNRIQKGRTIFANDLIFSCLST